MNSTEQEIRKLSDREFVGHVIEEKCRNGVYRVWRCGKPNDGNCAFTVTTIPGRIIVTGDLGCMVVERCFDMLPWCRRSVESTDYFASKIPHEFQFREHCFEKFKAWARQELADAKSGDRNLSDENQEVLEELIQWGDEKGPDTLLSETQEIWQGDDVPDWSVFTRRFYWLRDAIRWFVNNVNEPGLKETPNA